MKATEIRALSAQDLNKKLADLKTELFNLRFQHAVNQLDNPHASCRGQEGYCPRKDRAEGKRAGDVSNGERRIS